MELKLTEAVTKLYGGSFDGNVGLVPAEIKFYDRT
jgi:hypothetical protein